MKGLPTAAPDTADHLLSSLSVRKGYTATYHAESCRQQDLNHHIEGQCLNVLLPQLENVSIYRPALCEGTSTHSAGKGHQAAESWL